ncbi:MAG: DNA-binding protein [Gammaproteobacteria bacterium]|nr:DNA-binding protein [Gammaproteobacteria bacterium]
MPEFVDPFRLAEVGRTLQGRLALSRLRRLSDYLIADDGEAAIEIAFGVDEQGVAFARGRVRAVLMLQCQRCLEPMAWEVDTAFALGFVRSDLEGQRLPPGYEPSLIEDETVKLADLVEDELILALPQIPRHGEGETCRPGSFEAGPREAPSGEEGKGTGGDHPFAVLERLKGRR